MQHMGRRNNLLSFLRVGILLEDCQETIHGSHITDKHKKPKTRGNTRVCESVEDCF